MICGQNKLKESDWSDTKIMKIKPILNLTSSVEDAISNAPAYLQKIGQQLYFPLDKND